MKRIAIGILLVAVGVAVAQVSQTLTDSVNAQINGLVSGDLVQVVVTKADGSTPPTVKSLTVPSGYSAQVHVNISMNSSPVAGQ